MKRKNHKIKIFPLLIFLVITIAAILAGIFTVDNLDLDVLINKLFWPLCRLMFFICVGLFIGQAIEATGWTRILGSLAGPLFKFGNLGKRCSSAFVTAFISGVAANAMLLDFFKEKKISRKQLFLTNFVNQFPAYFLHLPTTFFIVIPLTGWAGAIYFIITFMATLLRTICFLIYGHFFLKRHEYEEAENRFKKNHHHHKKTQAIWKGVKEKLPKRMILISVYVIPIYTLIFILHTMGLFDTARKIMASYIVTSFIPVESLSVVILSFAAEFTSGFAAAGALFEAGILTVKQTVLALLIGNIIAFPVRAIRHQLPRYVGIFSPRIGTQLLLMGQGFRILSLLIMMILYYYMAP